MGRQRPRHLGAKAEPSVGALNTALEDPKPWVRVAAADALTRLDRVNEALPTLTAALHDDDPWVRLWSINILDRLDLAARPARETIAAARKDENPYVVRVAERAMEAFP